MAHDVSSKPVQMLYGHIREVKCVTLSWELDVAVSVDKVMLVVCGWLPGRDGHRGDMGIQREARVTEESIGI